MAAPEEANQTLRSLFATQSGQYPFLIPKALIVFHTPNNEKMEFTAKSPSSGAQILEHLQRHDGEGLFQRQTEFGYSPISISMEQQIRLQPNDMEHTILAFRIIFLSLEDESIMEITHPETRTYKWVGGDRRFDKDPITSSGPRINDIITALKRAENNWQNVNLITISEPPALKLVVNNTQTPNLTAQEI